MTKLYFVNGFSELDRITPDEFCLFSLRLDDVRLSWIALISSYVAVPFLLKEGSHEITTPVDDWLLRRKYDFNHSLSIEFSS